MTNERPVFADLFNPVPRSFPVSRDEPALLRGLDAILAHTLIAATRLVTDVRGRWIGCEPQKRVRIYFANHTSHLDFLLLWSVLPAALRRRARPVAARDYWQSNGVRRHFAERVFHSVFVERNPLDRCSDPTTALVETLNEGDSLILFPEGTRGNGKSLHPFRSGIFHLAAARPEVELVPVWINNAGRVMPKGCLMPLPVLCTVTFGPAMRLAADEEKSDFLERLRRELMHVRRL